MHPALRLLGTPFWLGSKVRGARVLHPRGRSLAATLHVTGEGPLPLGERECVVRLSKSVGTPGDLPDVLGVALRYEDDGRPVDVLVASTVGTRGWHRFVLAPSSSWGRVRFSSLLPWESDDGTRVLVLMAVDDLGVDGSDVHRLAERLPVRIRVRVATADAVLQQGLLVVTGPDVPHHDHDPVLRHPPGWHFVPRWLAQVRLAAYASSRDGRPDTEEGPAPASRSSSADASCGAKPLTSLSK